MVSPYRKNDYKEKDNGVLYKMSNNILDLNIPDICLDDSPSVLKKTDEEKVKKHLQTFFSPRVNITHVNFWPEEVILEGYPPAEAKIEFFVELNADEIFQTGCLYDPISIHLIDWDERQLECSIKVKDFNELVKHRCEQKEYNNKLTERYRRRYQCEKVSN